MDDRITAGQARLLCHFTGAGEYGLALEGIAGTLAQDVIAITGPERAAMLALAARMNLEGHLVLRALAACPQTGGNTTSAVQPEAGARYRRLRGGPRPRRRPPGL